MLNILSIILICVCAYLGKTVSDKDKEIAVYHEALEACKGQSVADKILEKIRERQGD